MNKQIKKLGVYSLVLSSLAISTMINEVRGGATTGSEGSSKRVLQSSNQKDDARIVISKVSAFVSDDGTYQTSYEGVAQLSTISDKVQVTVVDREGENIFQKTYPSKNGETLLPISESNLASASKPNEVIFTIMDSAGNVITSEHKEIDILAKVSVNIDSAVSRTVDGSNTLQINGSASLGEKNNRLVVDIKDDKGLSLITRTWTGDTNLNLTISSVFPDFPSAKSVSFTILDPSGRKLAETQKDFSIEEVNTKIAITKASSMEISNQHFYKVTGVVERVNLSDIVYVRVYDKKNNLIKQYEPTSKSDLLVPIDIDDSVENTQPYKVEVSVTNANGVEKANKEILFNV